LASKRGGVGEEYGGTFADKKSVMNGSACVYDSGCGASPPTMKTSFKPHARTQSDSAAVCEGPSTQRAAKWGMGVWPRVNSDSHSVCVALIPREGEQVTDTREAGGRERMQSLDELSGIIS